MSNDLSITKNTAYIGFKDKNFDNFRCVKVISLTALSQYFTPKQHVDDAIDETP